MMLSWFLELEVLLLPAEHFKHKEEESVLEMEARKQVMTSWLLCFRNGRSEGFVSSRSRRCTGKTEETFSQPKIGV